MIQRNSEAAQFSAGQGVQAQQSQTGAARPDVAGNTTSRQVDAGTPVETSSDRLLTGIMGGVGKLADQFTEQNIKQRREEAYLSGQAAATTGQNEADLQEDIFTKNWATAGFRDTMGRISLADNSSRITGDMPKLREMDPEAFSDYMNTRRAELMPSLEGMSTEARKSVFSTMALNERAVFAQHAAEHRKFVWESQVNSIQTQFGTSKTALDVAAGSESPGEDSTAAYRAQTAATLGTLHQLTVQNPNVPVTARSSLIYEAAKDALSTNHQLLFEQMKSQPLPNGDGTMTTLFDQLSSNDRAKLEGAYRESRGRTAGAASANTLMDFAAMEASWANPDTPMQPAEEVKAKLESAFKSGYFGAPDSPDRAAATKMAGYWKNYSEAVLKKTGKFESASAWISGNVDAMRAAGKTRDEAMNNWQEQYGRKMPLDQNITTLVAASLSNGQYEGLKLAGTIMAPAWNRLRTNPDIDPASAKLVSGVLFKLDKETAAGHPAAMHQYLQSFDPDTQEMILEVQKNQAAGAGPTEAVLQAQSAMLERTKLDPAMRSAMAGQVAQENAKLITGMESKGTLGNLWQGSIKGIFSSAAATKGQINVKNGWFENPERVAEAQAIVKFAKSEELEAVTRSHPWADAATRDAMSDTAVARRAVQTTWGPFVVPKGQTLETYFGVKDGERVGEVLSTMVKPSNPDNRITFQTGANGELLFQELNANGGKARVGHLDPKTVKQAVAEARDAEVQKTNIIQGQGITKVVNGISVNYSGSNSLGVDPAQMFEFRSRLIKHEGVVDVAKDDIGGSINKKTGKVVQTGGVGLSDTNDFFPKLAPGQKFTPEQISNGLRDSSEAAARTAQNWIQATGSTNLSRRTPLFQLFGELAFQGGAGNKAYSPLLAAIRDNDYPNALKALQATPAYKMAGDSDRRKFYFDTLTKALKD